MLLICNHNHSIFLKNKLKLLIIILISSGCVSSEDDAMTLKPETFQSKVINDVSVQLVDIRTPEEFDSGHIENAININYFSEQFKDSISLLQTKIPVYIYCRSGMRSSKSVKVFKAVGFDSIYQLNGGLLNWKKSGFKIISN